MKLRILVLLLLTFMNYAQAQSFLDFISELETTPDSLRQVKVDSFMLATESFPVTEDDLAHFIYTGSGSNLSVPGDFSGWNPQNAPMTKVSATNFWYRTEQFDNDARLDYKFVYNGSTWILDPRNPYFAPGGFGNNSELRMPEFIPPWEIQYTPNIPHGTLEDTTFYSTNLNNSRTIKVYLPPGYFEAVDSYPVVLVHDGLEYISFSKMNNVIDNLISEELIQPLIAVFVPPVDRSPEYIDGKQDDFTLFIIEEVMPWVDGKYRTKTEAAERMVMGSSAGGNISLWLSMKHPETFGIAGPFSPYIEDDIQNYFSANDRMDLRIFMIHGKYDHLAAIQNSVNNFLPILEEKEYDYVYGEYPEGHSYGFWRAYIDEALIFAFPGSATDIQSEEIIPETITLYQNYPNPFNPATTIEYLIPVAALSHVEGLDQNPAEAPVPSLSAGRILNVQLKIFDILGREVTTLVNERQGPGSYQVNFNADNLSSGVYFYKLLLNNHPSQSRKMLLLR